MKVFISWSGQKSRRVADALKVWLKDILHEADTWMSEHDIDAGIRWANRLNDLLETSDAGIVCLTAANQNSPWLLFESGSISKSVNTSRLIPYVIDLELRDVKLPLSQFQCVRSDRDGTWRLVQSVNSALALPLDDERLKRLFERLWPDLERVIEEARDLSEGNDSPPPRSDSEVLNEILELVRVANRHDRPHLTDYDGHIEIDTRPLLAENGRVSRILFIPDRTVSDFLDDVFTLVNRQDSLLSPYAYGDQWLLRNGRTGEVFSDIGVQYCRSRGLYPDDTPIYTLGIDDGDRLYIIPAREDLDVEV